MNLIFIAILFGAFYLQSCTAENTSESTSVQVPQDSSQYYFDLWKKEIATNSLPQALDSLFQSNQRLYEGAVQLCSNSSTINKEKVQGLWKIASQQWNFTETFLPEPLSYSKTLFNKWPTRPSLLQSNQTLFSTVSGKQVQDIGISSKGYPATEYYLFDTTLFLKHNTKECYFLQSITNNLVLETQSLQEQWKIIETQFVKKPQGHLQDTSLFYSAILIMWISNLEEMKANKILKPLKGSGSTPWPESVEAKRSQSSLEKIQASLLGIQHSFEAHDHAFALSLEKKENQAGHIFSKTLQSCLDKEKTIPRPLFTALESSPQTVQSLYDCVTSLVQLLKIDIATGFNVRIGLGDTDGD